MPSLKSLARKSQRFTVRQHSTPSRVATIKKTDNSTCEQDCGEIGILIPADGNGRQYSHFGKQSGNSTLKGEMELPNDTAIPLLNIHPGQVKTSPLKKLHKGTSQQHDT